MPALKDENKNISPVKLELLTIIVDTGRANYYTGLLHSFDCNLQILSGAHGTAKADVLDYLGLTDSNKAVIMGVVRGDMLSEAMSVLQEKFATVKNGSGIAFSIPLTSVIGKLIFGFLCNDRGTVKNV